MSALTFSQCRKSDVAPSLPPESATGTNNAGYLADGSGLVPRDRMGAAGTNLAYKLGTTARTAWSDLGILDTQDNNAPFVPIQAAGLVLEEGRNCAFGTGKGVPTAFCVTPTGSFTTISPAAGTLTITRLDRPTNLVAGRFVFVGTDRMTGQQVRVTQRRFDFRAQ